jgi:hypothetical protein
MTRSALRMLAVSLAVLAAFAIVCEMDLGGDNQARAEYRVRSADQMFHNYYVPPCGYPTTGAQLYVSPRPTPPLVGHTWITYEPLMPHEFLWKHRRTYIRHLPNGKTTRTTVHWH